MREFIKKNRGILIWFCIVVMFFVAIGSRLMSMAEKKRFIALYSENALTEAPRKLTESYKRPEELNMCIRCAGTGYTLWLPDNAEVKHDMVTASVGDLNILVTVADDNMEYMLSEVIPKELYFAVLGYKPKADVIIAEKGYLYQYAADYAVCVSSIQVSVRKVSAYIMAYMIDVSENNRIYICVVAESEDMIESGKKLLDAIGISVRDYDVVEPEIQNAVANSIQNTNSDNEEEKQDSIEKEQVIKEDEQTVLNIHLNHEEKISVEDGIFVVMWENYQDEPIDLQVFNPEGVEIEFMEQESTPGFYVYYIGKANAGTYTLSGSTHVQLRDTYIEVYERAAYDSVYGYGD